MKNHRRLIILIYILFSTVPFLRAEQNPDSGPRLSDASSAATPALPFIGAQVFIEPGQTPAEIDTWFRVLKENHFTRLPDQNVRIVYEKTGWNLGFQPV